MLRGFMFTVDIAGSFSELMPVVLNVLFGMEHRILFPEHELIVLYLFSGVPQALSNIQMILICVITDVLPALSMVMEKPEADLLLRKPRHRKKDRLVNFRLMLHAYFFIGILECFTSMVGWVHS